MTPGTPAGLTIYCTGRAVTLAAPAPVETLYPLLTRWEHGDLDDDQLIDAIRALDLPPADRGIKGMGVHEVEATGEERWADWPKPGTRDEVRYLATLAPWFPEKLARRLLTGR